MSMTVQQLIDKLTDIPYEKRAVYKVEVGIANEDISAPADIVEVDDIDQRVIIINEW